jgi:hypothetical protein
MIVSFAQAVPVLPCSVPDIFSKCSCRAVLPMPPWGRGSSFAGFSSTKGTLFDR